MVTNTRCICDSDAHLDGKRIHALREVFWSCEVRAGFIQRVNEPPKHACLALHRTKRHKVTTVEVHNHSIRKTCIFPRTPRAWQWVTGQPLLHYGRLHTLCFETRLQRRNGVSRGRALRERSTRHGGLVQIVLHHEVFNRKKIVDGVLGTQMIHLSFVGEACDVRNVCSAGAVGRCVRVRRATQTALLVDFLSLGLGATPNRLVCLQIVLRPTGWPGNHWCRRNAGALSGVCLEVELW